MSDGKRPTKGTLRLAPQANKPAGTPAKATAAKSGARRAAAAAARGERLRPAAPLPGKDDGGRPAPARGDAKGRKPTADGRGGGWTGGRTEGRSEGQRAGQPARRGQSRPAGEPVGDRAGERRGREAPAGRQADDRAPRGGKRPAGRAWDERPAGKPGRPEARRTPAARPAASEAADEDVMDVWAQARANLAARVRKPAAERTPRPAKATPAGRRDDPRSAAAPAAEAAEAPSRPVPDHPLYDPQGVRVSKLLADQGLCSRREADDYIARGWVLVDGQRVTELGLRVSPAARVTLAPEARSVQTQQVTILLHKPVGYVSGQPEPGYAPAASLIGPANQMREPDEPVFHPGMLKGLAPAGRLDIDSTGLLVLTQDGRVARQLIGDDTQIEKEYIVRVEGALIDNGLALLNHGLSLDDQPLRPARVEWINDDQLRFVLREGRKRQIRRMCELVGLHVVGLKRVRIGRVRLGDLPAGCWRLLRAGETF